VKFINAYIRSKVVSLVPEDYPVAMIDFYKSVGIKLFPLGLDGD